jgi:hypothetical protein
MEDMPILSDHLVFNPVNSQDGISDFPASWRNVEELTCLRALECPPADYAVVIRQ